jgi:PIN domain nuclease of toxin-antitoxin system
VPVRVPRAIRELIAAPSVDPHFSLVSIWEVALRHSLGKLDVGAATVAEHLEASGFTRLDLRVEHLVALEGLPWHHRDPFDRLLVAQGLTEPMALITADSRLAAYGANVRVI